MKTPVIIRETGVVSDYLGKDRWYKFKQWVYAIAYKQADAIIAPSQHMLDDLNNFLNIRKGKQSVIPNFVVASTIDHCPGVDEHNQWDLKLDKPVIISVGRLEEVKGLDVALEAIAELKKEIDCYYWVLGQGTQENRLKEICKQFGLNDTVYFLGFQKSPYAFLKKADILLLSSRSEGFPNALLEAMYCGLPSVTTSCGPSVISHNIDGLVVEVGNAQNIAAGLKKILKNDNLKKRFGINARKKSKLFMEKNILKQYEELFLEMAIK